MEWPAEFQLYSPLEECSYGLWSSPMQFDLENQAVATEWTFEDNKLFENALAEINPLSPAFFENVAARIPWKSIEEIKCHYDELVEDVEMIESGRVPVPSDKINDVDHEKPDEKVRVEAKKDKRSLKQVRSTCSDEVKKKSNGQQRKRGVPWTEEEHELFLMGLNKYGKGDWRSISRYYVISKTPTQIASHAQKYYRRQNSSTPMDKRRPSIHDIKTVTPSTLMMTSSTPSLPPLYTHNYAANNNALQMTNELQTPNFSCGNLIQYNTCNGIGNSYGGSFGRGNNFNVIEQNSMFKLPINSTSTPFASATIAPDPIFMYQNTASSSSIVAPVADAFDTLSASYLLSSLRDQPCG